MKKERSNFLYLRLLAYSKRLHVFRKDEKEKRLTSFDLLNHLRMKAAPTRRAHKETQTPSPCESTLAVEFGLNHTLLVSPPLTD